MPAGYFLWWICMNQVKQRLYDLLLEEFNREPSFTLARTLYLFCLDNEDFLLPGNVRRQFHDGLREQEWRAFGMTYNKLSDLPADSGIKQDIIRKIVNRPKHPALQDVMDELVKQLSEGTGKIYTAKMIEKINATYKSALSYNDILEMFIMAQTLVEQQPGAAGPQGKKK
jgi:hypothetical protein